MMTAAILAETIPTTHEISYAYEIGALIHFAVCVIHTRVRFWQKADIWHLAAITTSPTNVCFAGAKRK
jgi:hypothetical protein